MELGCVNCCPQVVERALADVQKQFNRQEGSPTIGIVRLRGLLHTEVGPLNRQLASVAAI